MALIIKGARQQNEREDKSAIFRFEDYDWEVELGKFRREFAADMSAATTDSIREMGNEREEKREVHLYLFRSGEKTIDGQEFDRA